MLTTGQKTKNELISSTRIKVEHAISGIKIFRVIKDIEDLYEADMTSNLNANENDPHSSLPSPPLPPPRLRQG